MSFTGRAGQAPCACAAKEQTMSARQSRIRSMNLSYQRGLSAFGALVVIAIAVVAGYYVYKGVTGGGEAPTCDGSFTACMQICRRTSTEAPAAQACHGARERDAQAGKRKGPCWARPS